MSQYKQGYVSVTYGSAEVSGSGTLWDSAGIQPGYLFCVENEDVWYYIASVDSNTLLTLSSSYQGSDKSLVPYAIVRDYTVYYSLPLLSKGDTNWTGIYNEAMLKISTALQFGSGGSGGGGGVSGSLNDAYLIGNVIQASGAPVLIYRSGTYGGTDRITGLALVDQNTSGVTGLPYPSGGLLYTYSKHRAPFISITNQASRQNPSSVSTTAPAGIIGAAFADEHEYFTSLPTIKNVGIAGFAVDYHGAVVTNANNNVGVYAYSQRGYGISAYSYMSYAGYFNSPSPVYITNSNFASGDTEFAVDVYARRAGIRLISLSQMSDTYPGILISGTGTAIHVSGGAVKLFSPNTVPLTATTEGSSTYAITASASNVPSIRSVNGIDIYIDNHTNIVNPTSGTLVYSNSLSRPVFYTGQSWIALAVSGEVSGGQGGSGCCSLQESYLEGRTISANNGAVEVSASNTPVLSVSSTQTTAGASGVIGISTSGAPAISIFASGPTALSEWIRATSSGGTLIALSTSSGKLIDYESTVARGTEYAAEFDVYDGRGIRITTNDSNTDRFPLHLQSVYSTLIYGRSNHGALIDYVFLSGMPSGLYAISMGLASGGGISIENESLVHYTAKFTNTASGGKVLRIEGSEYAETGVGLEILNTDKGAYIEGNTSYAIEAYSIERPSIKSVHGIVIYSPTLASVPNPEPGTLTYHAFDGLLYYYIQGQGWMPISPSGEIVLPSGGPSCDCTNGSVIYSANINNIVNPLEGTIVYNAVDKNVYVYDGSDFKFVGGEVSGGSGAGVVTYSTKGVNFLVTGTLSAETNVASFICPFNGAIRRVKATVDTAPQGANIALDINLNGSSILSSPLLIYTGQTQSQTVYLNTPVNEYDTISLDIDQVGSTNPGGNDLRVIVYLQEESDITDTYVNITTSDSPYSVLREQRYIFAQPTTGNISVYLPAPSACPGLCYTIKRVRNDTTYTVIVSSPEGGTIDGQSSQTMSEPYEVLSVVSNMSNFFIV